MRAVLFGFKGLYCYLKQIHIKVLSGTTTAVFAIKEVLYMRWNEHHLSAYLGTLMTQL